ncbi:dienelactone hydrolase family protein [Pseudooceanicola sp. LIPI14-2-Ac024]|uniref:dienelactone hydrolase family protein n=1 Tax=Pseudooceanicola sp. LIPI14-2-Ac024 TaxID=3344875 RepID=UPI0035CFF270
MAHIVLFHSVLGLRPVEHGLAAEWRRDGHTVTLPDLFGGRTAETYDAGFAILEDIGLETVTGRALDVAAGLPDRPVLAGVSLGAGMAARAWAARPDARGVLLLCGPAPWPDEVTGTPVQMHAARPEPFDDEAVFDAWKAANPGADLQVHRYDGVGHYFLDPSLPDYGAAADAKCRAECRRFLSKV